MRPSRPLRQLSTFIIHYSYALPCFKNVVNKWFASLRIAKSRMRGRVDWGRINKKVKDIKVKVRLEKKKKKNWWCVPHPKDLR